MRNKVITAAQAVAKIEDGAFIALGGINVSGAPLELIDGIAERYNTEGHPKGIGLIHSGGHSGTIPFSAPGLLSVYFGGFVNIKEVINSNDIPAYSLSQGICNQLYRAQGSHLPYITRVGLHTYLDPRQKGGALNEKARANPVVDLLEISGEEFLHFKIPPIKVALIRATTADPMGNLTDEDEMLRHEMLPIAMAAHNNGGIVIAQVKNLAQLGSLRAADIKVPGMMVDYIVVCSDPEKWHIQNLSRKHQPGLTGYSKIDESTVPFHIWEQKDDKLIMARRGVTELWPGCVANVGLGASEGVAYIGMREGVSNRYHMIIEMGVVDGIVGGGPFFSSSFNATAHMTHHEMFDFINGGGLDVTFLGAAEIGEDGSVNVTRIAGRANGSGGFVNISSNTQKVVFMTLHTAGGKATAENGALKIITEGKPLKFVKEVAEIAFNGKEAFKNGKDVTYITERAVFKLIGGKVTLVEYAEGLDLERDIIGLMGFRPEISPDLKTMPAHCFTQGSIGLKEMWDAEG